MNQELVHLKVADYYSSFRGWYLRCGYLNDKGKLANEEYLSEYRSVAGISAKRSVEFRDKRQYVLSHIAQVRLLKIYINVQTQE
jgi:hypothetical protein